MSLPDITSRLPRSIDSPQSRRLRTFLLHVDEKLEPPWTITIYGSEDALLLRERYIEEVSSVEKRVFEAAKYYAMSNRARRQIEYAFEGIFEQPIDLSGLT